MLYLCSVSCKGNVFQKTLGGRHEIECTIYCGHNCFSGAAGFPAFAGDRLVGVAVIA